MTAVQANQTYPKENNTKEKKMATSVHNTCVTTDENPTNFALNFTVSDQKWTKGGDTQNKATKTRSGIYKELSVPINSTILYKDDGTSIVAEMGNFKPSIGQENDTGTNGKAEETGRPFKWKVEIVVE